MKSALHTIVALVLSYGLVSAGEKRAFSSSDIGQKIEIIGDLGVPVGKVVTITGQKKQNGPYVDHFWVSTVDGKKKAVGIIIEGIADWPEGTEATLKGCEVGTLTFRTEAGANYAPNDPRWKGPYQELTLTFTLEKIVFPKNLRLKKK